MPSSSSPTDPERINRAAKEALEAAKEVLAEKLAEVADRQLLVRVLISHPDIDDEYGYGEAKVHMDRDEIEKVVRKKPKSNHKMLAAKPPDDTFIPRERQANILAALKGKALRADALAALIDCDRSQLYQKHGVKELEENGLVKKHPAVGYYSTQHPPPELRESDPQSDG